MKNKLTVTWGWLERLVRIIRGDDLREVRKLEAIMQHWHKEEMKALAKAEEALECGNLERSAMWMARCHEARLRCNKDFRRPMIELTGKSDLFESNVKVEARGE